jgi:hypothetical protein
VISGASIAAPKAGIWGAAIVLLLYFLLYFGYYAFYEIFWNGQIPANAKPVSA